MGGGKIHPWWNTSEISNVYSSTDNLIVLGDYNIHILEESGKQLLNNFIADNGLQYVNTKKSNMEKCGKKFFNQLLLYF